MKRPLKIVVTGPESTGKTFLVQHLSRYFSIPANNEFCREYLEKAGGEYTYDDLYNIAQGQLKSEVELLKSDAKMVICDTDLLTICIWSQHKYGKVDSAIRDAFEKQLPDLYLICKPDIEWEPDPLRENPDKGDFFFEWYVREIKKLGVPYFVVEGEKEKRIHAAVKKTKNIF